MHDRLDHKGLLKNHLDLPLRHAHARVAGNDDGTPKANAEHRSHCRVGGFHSTSSGPASNMGHPPDKSFTRASSSLPPIFTERSAAVR